MQLYQHLLIGHNAEALAIECCGDGTLSGVAELDAEDQSAAPEIFELDPSYALWIVNPEEVQVLLVHDIDEYAQSRARARLRSRATGLFCSLHRLLIECMLLLVGWTTLIDHEALNSWSAISSRPRAFGWTR